MTEVTWSETEQTAAQEAFNKAYEREINSLIEGVKQQASAITELDELWRLHDFLSAKRHEIEGKYDYRYSVLVFVFAKLLQEGWLTLEELQFLDRDKLAKIKVLAMM